MSNREEQTVSTDQNPSTPVTAEGSLDGMKIADREHCPSGRVAGTSASAPRWPAWSCGS
jgi:hypothetical protein